MSCLLYSEKLSKKVLDNVKPTLVISYNYSFIVPKEVIEYANTMNIKMINMHISLLPYNKGSNPNFWSFIDDTPKGVSIHVLEPVLDEGGIIYQKEIFFDENIESLKSSYEKLQKTIITLFKEHWDEIISGNFASKKQSGAGSWHDMKMYNDFIGNKIIDYNESIAKMKEKLLN